MFLTHFDKALEIEKFKRSRENKIEFAYDYGNLNASYVNEKINFEDDYFQEIINPDFDKIDSPFQQTSSLKPYIPNVIREKIIIDLEDEVVSLLEKEKANLKTIESLKSKGFESSKNVSSESKNQSENDCLVVEKECDKEENPKVIAPRMFKLNVSQMCDLLDDNNFFTFDDESVKISLVSKMPFRKKPRDSMDVRSKSTMNKSLPRTMHKWLLKLQPLAEPAAKWFPRVKHCPDLSLGHRFGMFKAYDGDVVIGSMMIKIVYYVEVLGHNLFSVGQFCDKGLEVAFRKSTCFVRNEDGVDLLTADRSSNLYTIALNEVASNSSTCLPKMKFEKDHLCFTCEQGKIHRKHHMSKTAFASNKPLYLLHMDLCGPMRVQSINGKRYVLVVVDDYSRYTWVFFLHSKDEASEMIITFIKKTQVNLQLQVQRVRSDNGTEFKNKTLAKFFDEIMKSSTTNVETSINEEVFHESISNNMIPNGDEASTSHNVFNERLEDAYFDASTLFHDPSNVYTYYQPYPHENKWTKDHPLHKIIGDPKSSVRKRGQLANSCLFSCLLSSIEPANLKYADWVSAMQDELDQFARLKVWRLVPRPEGFVSKQYPDHVYALDKTLYGLKQAPRAWYAVLS
nr:hypothetical protein [Tanacetum cinerariifolium]